MKQKLERNKPSSSRIPSFTKWASGKCFFIQAEGLFFVFFPSQNQFLKLTNSCCFCTLDMGLQSRCVVPVCTYVYVCVCVCARAQIMCAEWTLWGSAHEGSALLEYVSPCFPLHPFLLFYWETVPSTNSSVPGGASGFFSPLTLVKNVFWEPWESLE